MKFFFTQQKQSSGFLVDGLLLLFCWFINQEVGELISSHVFSDDKRVYANLTVRARAMEPDLRVLSRRRLVAFLYRCWAKNRDFSFGLRGGGVFGRVWEEGLIRFG